MTDEPNNYIRKPFVVKGWRVTEENLDDVAKWCGGEVLEGMKKAKYVKVPVSNPLTLRHTKAFIGDWVLSATDKGYKVYTNKAFERTFETQDHLTRGTAGEGSVTGYPNAHASSFISTPNAQYLKQ